MPRSRIIAALAALLLAPATAAAAPPPILGPVAVTDCQIRVLRLLANGNYVTVDPINFALSASSQRADRWERFMVCREPGTNLATLQLESTGLFVTADLTLNNTVWAALSATAPAVTSGREMFVLTTNPTGRVLTLQNVASGRYVTATKGGAGFPKYLLTASAPAVSTPWETFSWWPDALREVHAQAISFRPHLP